MSENTSYMGITNAAREQMFSFLESDEMGWEITSDKYRANTWYGALRHVVEESGLKDEITLVYQPLTKKVFIINLNRFADWKGRQ